MILLYFLYFYYKHSLARCTLSSCPSHARTGTFALQRRCHPFSHYAQVFFFSFYFGGQGGFAGAHLGLHGPSNCGYLASRYAGVHQLCMHKRVGRWRSNGVTVCRLTPRHMLKSSGFMVPVQGLKPLQKLEKLARVGKS